MLIKIWMWLQTKAALYGAAIIAGLGVLYQIKRSGYQQAEKEALEGRLDAIQRANKVENEVIDNYRRVPRYPDKQLQKFYTD